MIGRTCMLFICLFSCFWSTAAAQGPRFSPPGWIEVSEVSGNMAIAGLPTGALHLVSSRPAAAVLDHFRSLWNCGAGEKRCREAEMPPWSVLSRLEGKKLEYVQIRDLGAGATGYLGLSEIKRQKARQTNVPMMQGSRVVNDMVSSDLGKKGRVMLLSNTYSVASNGTFYTDYFIGRGWQRVTEDNRIESQVLIFHKGSEEAHLVISRQQGATQVVINMVQ
ncbi:MAG: hypothetical protein VR65_14615 [Desulfobulbaceae bacterium BRH_c16a]|nr:MAG: hypothetical protein VR65_14615 [Desulfobulbaceae bacterium BRH_c16a]